nr:reverse transcriptase domain-containing protein [Tanacetum cinerariifolium]
MLQEGFEGEHDIEFKERNSVKGKILADFLAETPSEESEVMEAKKPVATDKELESDNMWRLYTDGASSSNWFWSRFDVSRPRRKRVHLRS